MPFRCHLRASPCGSFIKTFTEPVILNGTATNMSFDEYATGTGAGQYVAFYATSNLASGELQYNLLDFLNEAATTTAVGNSWWLAGIEYGTEFGDTSSVNYTLTLTKLEVEQTLTTGN